MFRHKYCIVVAIMVIVLSFGVISCTMSGTTSDVQSLRGILKKIDSISGAVTVVLNDGSTVTFNLDDINVETIGKAPGNASLEIGSEVTIVKDKSGKITGLSTQVAEIEGVIKRLDSAKQQVTITLDEKGQLTLSVTNATVIVFGSDAEATFVYLKTGQRIEATYHVENKNILKLCIYEEESISNGVVRGKITLIDEDAKTIKLESENGVTIPLLQVTPTTKLWFDRAGTFERLYAGMEVKVKYNPETLEIIYLHGNDTRSPIEKFLDKSS